MLFLVLLLSFIIGEFCLEFIVLYKEFADLDASWKISCQGDPTWGDVYPYSEGTFTPYWKTNDCETLILPDGGDVNGFGGYYRPFKGGTMYFCANIDPMCSALKAGSKGIGGTIYFNFGGKQQNFHLYCHFLFDVDIPYSMRNLYYNIPMLASSSNDGCTIKSGGSNFALDPSDLLPGSEITPVEGSGIKSILIPTPQGEPTEGDRYIFKVDFSGLSKPWLMVTMCAKKKARKECFSDKTVVLEKDSFGNFSLSIGKSSLDVDTYIQISVYEFAWNRLNFAWSEGNVYFTHRFIKEAEEEFEPTVFPYTSSTGFDVYFHMLNCPSDYTDCDKDGTRDVVVTIFGISSEDQAKGLLVQGVETTVDFTCVVTSHTCSGTVTALLHKSTMFNYTPQKGCLGMLPPRTSSHVFQCGGIFIQIKE